MQLVSGQKSSLQVGDLPRIVAEYLGCHPAIVYLGHNEVIKIVRKHSAIRVEELQCLPFAIAKGEYREDQARGKCVTVFYNEPSKNKLYIIGLKSACRGGEVWVQSFYRLPLKTVEANGNGINCFGLGKFRRASLGKRDAHHFHSQRGLPGTPYCTHACPSKVTAGRFSPRHTSGHLPIAGRQAPYCTMAPLLPESPILTPVFNEVVDK
jgi:hypothetical protein